MKLYDILKIRLITESAKHVDKTPMKTDIRDCMCIVDGCGRNAYARGLCNAHYLRSRKGGDMSVPIKNRKGNSTCSVCGVQKIGRAHV
jgi:hypothetical protein